MDPDADNASEGSRALRGFRRRWARASSEPATERSEVISLHSDHNLDVFPQLFGEYSPSVADDLDAAGWQFVEPSVDHLESSQFESLKRPLDVSSKSLHDSCPVVLDPCGSEPSWRATALEAEIKRAKTNLDKLPWEVDGSVFKTRDLWQGYSCFFAGQDVYTCNVWCTGCFGFSGCGHQAIQGDGLSGPPSGALHAEEG